MRPEKGPGRPRQPGRVPGFTDRTALRLHHIAALSAEETARIEDEVNQAILAALPVARETMSLEAPGKGATAFSARKNGDEVRVVTVPGVSMELCGGTHLSSTGQAGSFLILSETGVAAGVRRIAAAPGKNVLAPTRAMRVEYEQGLKTLKAAPGELPGRIKKLFDDIRALTREKEQLAANWPRDAAGPHVHVVRSPGPRCSPALLDGSNINAQRGQKWTTFLSKRPRRRQPAAAPDYVRWRLNRP
jgi:alanyl-tRNA synthetase